MASVNKVIIIGNSGADTELRTTNTGRKVANFRLATNEKWKDKEGNAQERTEWHTIIAWDRLGEVCHQYIKKGRSVYVEGRLQTRSWEDKDGIKRYTTEIVCLTMQLLGSPNGSGGGRPDKQPGYTPGAEEPIVIDSEDEIPF